MSIHKLTAGDGYSYLTRQVAAVDATDRGHTGLADYYSQRGESPGQWLGSALGDVDLHTGQEVTADQMASLFAEGKHPNADSITRNLVTASGGRTTPEDIATAASLGRPFKLIDTTPAFRVQVASRCAEVNAALGMPQDWPLTAVERAQIRTDVGRQMFAEEYGRAPKDPRELSSFIARHSRAATTAVAGFDLTFTPVKSVSALWAIAPREVAQEIHAAHHAAVQDALGWLERDATYTRGGGDGGVQQLDTTGLLAAAFEHRDSRAGDPDLHTHVAVSAKVRVRERDGARYPHGRWLALDGRVLYKATVTASERYNTRVEAELHARLGVTFTERSDAAAAVAGGRRTIREITGLPEQLLTVWSSRRARIDVRRAQLAAGFQAAHGRPPTPIEAVKLAQQATLETRDAKHAPRSEAEQRRQWRAEAADVLGGDRAVTGLVASLTASRPGPRAQVTPLAALDPATVQSIVEATKTVIESGRSTWQVWHVRSEAERQARAKAPAGADVDALVEHVVATVLAPSHSVPLRRDDPVPVPDVLRRRDGVSVYEVAGSAMYTSAAVLADEAYLLDAAGQRGGRVVTNGDVDMALLESVANGVTLNTAQAHLVRQLATSGARVQLAIAPAGSGKTTAMAALTRAWTGGVEGGGTVLGLAPSAVAAAILGQETGAHADTLAKLVWGITHASLPAWAAAVDERTLIVVDEAGMAATGDLAAVTRFALDRGASVRLVGDDRQLASVAAGGVLRDIQATAGAVTLSELIRFRDQAEAAASLAIRAGDTTGIGFYIDHNRVHVGDLTTVTDSAYTAWAADRDAGLDAIMLAPTRELATALNIRARQDRLDRLAHLDGQTGPEITLVDGSAASAGDVVVTRRNDRRLRTTATDFVKNGDRWTVTAARGDGSLDVVHTSTGRHLNLPVDYVREHVQLGYATTVHGGQGVTADTSHTVTAGAGSRQQLYVALTRGRAANHVYLVTAGDGDEHSVITPAATHPLTAVNVLEQILARDEAQVSATSTGRQLADPAADAAAAAARYRDSLHTAAVHLHGPGWAERLDATLEQQVPGIAASPAYPTLRGHLALLAATGQDPVTAFTTALTSREVDTAADAAAVLDWRLDPTHTRSHTGSPGSPGPVPWLPGIPAALSTDPYWGAYLLDRRQHVLDATADVRAAAAEYIAGTAPGWARQLLTPEDRQLLADLAVFRATHAVPDDDTRLTGPRQQAAADRRAQQALDNRLTAVLDTGYRSAWIPVAVQAGLNPRTDPHWPGLVENLAALSRAGADAPALLRAAAADGPLPDEYQAAAIWWRIAGRVSPAVLSADRDAAAADPLRPDWLPQLQDRLGEHTATQLQGDPHWPAVVTAVHRGLDHGIPLTDLLRAPAGPDGDPVPDHALADALIYRALTLTDQPPADPDNPDDPTDPGAHYLEPDDPDRSPPEDLHMLTADVDPFAPINAADSPLDYSHAGVAPVAPLPPLAADSLASAEMALAEGDLEEELWHATQRRQSMRAWEPSDEQLERALTRAADAEFSPVTPERIAALNADAADFYQHTYPGSWAQTYLTGRLGVDLTGDPATRPGYAPTGWTALTSHLRRRGATDEELLAAGLARQASTGRLIDTFRDRLILPIHHTNQNHDKASQVVGFVGRRNPDTDPLEAGSDAAVKAGPKYLNTAETVLFSKGEQLYGMTEYADRLAAGATPVLVEGPIDALAVTLASPDHVGVAPLGTALTDTQADTLIPYLHTSTDSGGGPGIIVATDPDLAGQLAAERDYWMLTARGGDPRHATLPAGLDPADLLRTAGPAALRQRLQQARPLADTLIDERLAHLPPQPALKAALTVVAAGHPQHWTDRTADIARRLHTPTDVALTELLPRVGAWDADRHTTSDRLAHAGNETRDRLTALATQTPAQRWAPLARQIDPALIAADDWGALANRIDATLQAGLDVHTLLPAIAAQTPLSPHRPATDLRYRLTALVDIPDQPTPPRPARPAATTKPSNRPRAPRHPTTPGQSPDTGPRR